VFERRIGGELRVDHGCELEGVALDALRVLARTRVLGAERGRKRGDRLAVRTFEQAPLGALDLDEVTQVTRIEDELLLAGAVSRAAHRRRRAGACQALDDTEKLERAERL